MKQLVKVFNQPRLTLFLMGRKITRLGTEKLKVGIFDGIPGYDNKRRQFNNYDE